MGENQVKVLRLIAIIGVIIVLIIFGVSLARGHPNFPLLGLGVVGLISLVTASRNADRDRL